MEIDSLSGRRFEIALEIFLEGNSINYKGIVFYKDSKFLHVSSYSDYLLENTTEAMAHEKIKYSKVILKEFEDTIPEFKAAVSGLAKQFAFCYDYHTGAVAIATEINNVFKWLIDK